MSQVIDRKTLTMGQRNRLKRYICSWCEHRLDHAINCCGAIWEKCDDEVRLKKINECLAEYKPRSRA